MSERGRIERKTVWPDLTLYLQEEGGRGALAALLSTGVVMGCWQTGESLARTYARRKIKRRDPKEKYKMVILDWRENGERLRVREREGCHMEMH